VCFQTLNDFDFKLFVLRLVSRHVSKDNFADLLSFVRALTDERAVTSEQMFGKEFLKVALRTVFVFVDVFNQHLGECKGVSEGCINRA
jgi:hypothetical protein